MTHQVVQYGAILSDAALLRSPSKARCLRQNNFTSPYIGIYNLPHQDLRPSYSSSVHVAIDNWGRVYIEWIMIVSNNWLYFGWGTRIFGGGKGIIPGYMFGPEGIMFFNTSHVSFLKVDRFLIMVVPSCVYSNISFGYTACSCVF